MRIIQMIDALDYGDGVSNDVIHLHEMLDDLKVSNLVFSKFCNEIVSHYTQPIDQYIPEKGDVIIYHFSGKSSIMEVVLKQQCRRIVRYHNVTPPEMFLPQNPRIADDCREGIKQIKENIAAFDGVLAVSKKNAEDIIALGAERELVDVLPIVFDFEKTLRLENTAILKSNLKTPYFLYVGRIAKNKCIEDVMRAFEYYFRFHNSSAYLYLVGNNTQDLDYTESLKQLKEKMVSKDQIMFTGKVSEEELATYYRGATALLCMSEHEGFCMPLLECSFFEVPIIAYDIQAIHETTDYSGILMKEKNPSITAHLMDLILNDEILKQYVIKKQQDNLEKYSKENITKQLRYYLNQWKEK